MKIDQNTSLQKFATALPVLPHGHVDNYACNYVRALAARYPEVTLGDIGLVPGEIARAKRIVEKGSGPTGGDIPPAGGTPMRIVPEAK
jgi:hypothetical protein